MINTRDGAAAAGKFWIEEATGRVLKTELRVTTGNTTATVIVAYESSQNSSFGYRFS